MRLIRGRFKDFCGPKKRAPPSISPFLPLLLPIKLEIYSPSIPLPPSFSLPPYLPPTKQILKVGYLKSVFAFGEVR